MEPDRVVVAEPDAGRRSGFRHGVADAASAIEWLMTKEAEAGSGGVMLAVKPQMLHEVGREASQLLSSGTARCVVSILAGMTAGGVTDALCGNVRTVRVMPNTPAQVRLGMSAIALGDHLLPADLAAARLLFGAVGDVVEIDEGMMDAFTAIAGSGPAYVFYLCEAMERAAARLGFKEAAAARIARATVVGAAGLMREDERAASELRAAVTSKKGTTHAACTAFDDAGLMAIVERAATAARDRGAELARGQ